MRNREPLEGRTTSACKIFALATLLLTIAGSANALAQTHAGQYEQADIEYGARLYAGHCITCHGERGDTMPGANLQSGQYRNAPTDRELSSLIRDGLPGTAMTPTEYSDSERTALVAYLRNMNTADLGGIALGDPARGRALFEGKGECDSCHRVNGIGPRSAPDLSKIGATRTAGTLQRSVLDPNAALLAINRPVRIVTRNGVVINGRRLNEDTFTVQLVDDQERLVSVDKANIKEFTIGSSALMPAYEGVFSDDERADLIAYLLSLKGLNQ